MAAGAAVFIVVFLLTPWDWRWTTRSALAWDAGVITFLVMVVHLMSQVVDAETMARRARRLDEGRGAILIISLAGAMASVAVVVAEMTLNKSDKGAFLWQRLGLMIATVALTWFFVQTIFALHYAHDYYMPGPEPGAEDLVTDDIQPPLKRIPLPYRGGLEMPGGDRTPDYWDFLYFSVVIGVASQTADINITSKQIRRMTTAHCIIAFIFNAVILALTINLSASLFS